MLLFIRTDNLFNTLPINNSTKFSLHSRPRDRGTLLVGCDCVTVYPFSSLQPTAPPPEVGGYSDN